MQLQELCTYLYSLYLHIQFHMHLLFSFIIIISINSLVSLEVLLEILLFLCTSIIQLIACPLTEVSIGLLSEKPLLPCLVSSHLSSSTFNFQSTTSKLDNFSNVFSIIGLPNPTCRNYQKKEVTRLGPCLKACLKLRKSFQNELAGKKIVWSASFTSFFLANLNWQVFLLK